MRHPASFRDPAGHLFEIDGVLYRRVEPSYGAHYDTLMASGLYSTLVAAGQLIGHEEIEARRFGAQGAHKIIKPARISPVTYPYEWTFGQLRAAALATLDVLSAALDRGMVLKDASAYNLQFRGPHPVFVDTLSFERYEEGRPWSAYNQFCRNFVVPLELARRFGPRVLNSLRVHADGLPVEWGSALLGGRGWLRFSSLFHIHLHARLVRSHRRDAPVTSGRRMSRRAFEGLIDSLRSAVTRGLGRSSANGIWTAYEDDNTYSDAGRAAKVGIVERALRGLQPSVVWDLGANLGQFAEIAARRATTVLALEGDAETAEMLYERTRTGSSGRIVTVRIDLANPSPASGWAHRERQSLSARGPADVLIALALIHHLVFTHNLPLDEIARWFGELGRSVIIEFVPPSDPQVLFLARYKRELLGRYDRRAFTEAFDEHFETLRVEEIEGSEREIHVMKRRLPGVTR